jgi:hypothetical protein
MPESDLAYRCHARALGSYLSGRPDSSDIDILISPPPAALEAAIAASNGSLDGGSAGRGGSGGSLSDNAPDARTLAAKLEPQLLLEALLEALLKKGYVTREVDFRTGSHGHGRGASGPAAK